MLRLSKMADYGLVVLTHVAQAPLGAVHTARSLAAHARLPQPTVGKVVKHLARAGLLQGHRGTRGGYSLARAAESISVAEVVAALDGPVAVTACLAHTGACALEGACPVRPGWQRLNDVLRSALESTSLAQMGGGRAPGAQLTQSEGER